MHQLDVRTWHDAKRILAEHGIEWTVAKQMLLTTQKSRWMPVPRVNRGIHIYVFNSDGLEVAYFTPMMESLLIHTTPRVWGDHIKTDDYDYNE